MKKMIPPPTMHEVDGPFLKSRQRLQGFGDTLSFTAIIQKTIDELEKCEEEYATAIFMGDTELALKLKREKEDILRSLAFASNLLEDDDGVSA